MSQQNTTVIVNVQQQLQPAFTSLNMGNIPAGTTPDQAVALLETQLLKNLATSWPASYTAYVSNQTNDGFMGPWANNLAGTAPSCVTQQIQSDLQDWMLPVDQTAITEMAQQITQNIANNGGLPGTFYGRSPLGPAVQLDWGVAYVAAIIADNPEELGIIYAFSAAENVV